MLQAERFAWKDTDFEVLRTLGGQGSGNFGHAGRPGEVGGSASTAFEFHTVDGSTVTQTLEKIDKKFGAGYGEKALKLTRSVAAGLATTGTVRIGLNGDGDLYTAFFSRTGPRTGIILERLYTKTATGVDVYHHAFELPKELQGKGLGAQMLATALDGYAELDVEHVSVHANSDVGGYAWGRLGFQQTGESFTREISRRLEVEATLSPDSPFSVMTPERATQLLQRVKEAGVDAPSVIANEPEGKELMLGLSWHGIINLKGEAGTALRARVREKAKGKRG